MPTYKFKGRRFDTGAVIEGERAAQSTQGLAATLRSEKIMPISINEKKAKAAARGMKGGKVTSQQIAIFTKQFSVMLEAGLPLVQSLGILAEQQENAAMAKCLDDVRADVEAGSTLAESMRKHPKVFDTLFVNMVAAGEAGGILDVILQRLSIFVEKLVKLKRSLVSASVYPGVVITVAIGIVVCIMVFVIPTFADLFKNMNATLPLPTRIVMGISDFMAAYILPVIAFLVLVVIAGQRYYTTYAGKLRIDGIILKILFSERSSKRSLLPDFHKPWAPCSPAAFPSLKRSTLRLVRLETWSFRMPCWMPEKPFKKETRLLTP